MEMALLVAARHLSKKIGLLFENFIFFMAAVH
jgi:hypothetical protein